jgi:hypothetical protein
VSAREEEAEGVEEESREERARLRGLNRRRLSSLGVGRGVPRFAVQMGKWRFCFSTCFTKQSIPRPWEIQTVRLCWKRVLLARPCETQTERLCWERA